jgi:F-type H+-transporting ATPase subunit delta
MPRKEANLSLAHVYAHALYDVAAQQGHVTEAEEELLALQAMLHAEPKLRRFLESPTIRVDQKHTIIRGLLESFHQPVVNFMCLVVKRQRIELFDEIVDEFHETANLALGIAEMLLESARQLTPEEAAQLKDMLEAKMQRKVAIREKIRPELLGGFVLRRGDLQWDASVSRRVGRLMDRIAESKQGLAVWKDE